MISKEHRERAFSALRESEEICQAISAWAEEHCKRLENPKFWDPKDFEIDGKSSMKASIMLKNLIFNLIKKEDKEVKKTSYE